MNNQRSKFEHNLMLKLALGTGLGDGSSIASGTGLGDGSVEDL
jgi:hypothetical protein